MSPARGDAELPPLPDAAKGKRGLDMVRAAYEATRPPGQTQNRRRRPFAVSKAQRPTLPKWTPHSALQGSPPIPTPGHWADGTPINDEPPPEEDQ